VPKTLTREQLQGRKEKAERFVRDVLGGPDRAAEIADESLEDYAARRKIKIVENPRQGGGWRTLSKEKRFGCRILAVLARVRGLTLSSAAEFRCPGIGAECCSSSLFHPGCRCGSVRHP